jgi:hypothetical protein
MYVWQLSLVALCDVGKYVKNYSGDFNSHRTHNTKSFSVQRSSPKKCSELLVQVHKLIILKERKKERKEKYGRGTVCIYTENSATINFM